MCQIPGVRRDCPVLKGEAQSRWCAFFRHYPDGGGWLRPIVCEMEKEDRGRVFPFPPQDPKTWIFAMVAGGLNNYTIKMSISTEEMEPAGL